MVAAGGRALCASRLFRPDLFGVESDTHERGPGLELHVGLGRRISAPAQHSSEAATPALSHALEEAPCRHAAQASVPPRVFGATCAPDIKQWLGLPSTSINVSFT